MKGRQDTSVYVYWEDTECTSFRPFCFICPFCFQGSSLGTGDLLWAASEDAAEVALFLLFKTSMIRKKKLNIVWFYVMCIMFPICGLDQAYQIKISSRQGSPEENEES